MEKTVTWRLNWNWILLVKVDVQRGISPVLVLLHKHPHRTLLQNKVYYEVDVQRGISPVLALLHKHPHRTLLQNKVYYELDVQRGLSPVLALLQKHPHRTLLQNKVYYEVDVQRGLSQCWLYYKNTLTEHCFQLKLIWSWCSERYKSSAGSTSQTPSPKTSSK